MPNTLLTELQSACRAAHEQAQMLQDLYEHLAGKESGNANASVDVGDRIAELRELQQVLAQKLKELDLLPTRPDPEREGLLEFITGMKANVTGEGRPAVDDRLASEEGELLQHLEQMLEHEVYPPIQKARARTRDAIARLS